MIVWDHEYRRDMALADALERDARDLSKSIWTVWQAWLARREAARLRQSMEPRTHNRIVAAPATNPDGTDASGRVTNWCQHNAFYARKARLAAKKSLSNSIPQGA